MGQSGRRVVKRPEPQPGIPAQFPADCPRCSEEIRVNDRIVFTRGHAIHVRCASGQEDV